MSEATDVLRAIDQLRRDLTGYHGQLKAHDDLQRHCENQRKRIGELEGLYADVKSENAKLRQQTELLVTLLRNDCDIEASWDGLRKFWYIGLTENGCLMRDRACKAEAENAKLRELVLDAYAYYYAAYYSGVGDEDIDKQNIEEIERRMRELGVEV